MAQYQVISHIALAENGPIVSKTVKHKMPQLVHLQQGSLDGACGPYCLCMALILLGMEKHSNLSNRKQTASSKRLFSFISERSNALVTEGTDLHVLKKYAKLYEGQGLKIESKTATIHGGSKLAKEGRKKNFKGVYNFIVNHVLLGRPVIFCSPYHYALVVGLGFENKISKEERPRHLLLLDPSIPTPTNSAWNGVIDIGVKGNNWYGTGGCTFDGAMALWKE